MLPSQAGISAHLQAPTTWIMQPSRSTVCQEMHSSQAHSGRRSKITSQSLHALRIGGRQVSGEISAASHPKAITGAGILQVPRVGTLILVR